jgi:predicted transcriptional regulator
MKGFDLMDFIEDSKTYVNVSGKSLYYFINMANKVDGVLVTEKDILDAAFVFATERPGIQ